MQSLNRNGVSITQTPGEEKFVKFRSGAFRGRWKSHATLTPLAKQDCPLWLQYD